MLNMDKMNSDKAGSEASGSVNHSYNPTNDSANADKEPDNHAKESNNPITNLDNPIEGSGNSITDSDISMNEIFPPSSEIQVYSGIPAQAIASEPMSSIIVPVCYKEGEDPVPCPVSVPASFALEFNKQMANLYNQRQNQHLPLEGVLPGVAIPGSSPYNSPILQQYWQQLWANQVGIVNPLLYPLQIIQHPLIPTLGQPWMFGGTYPVPTQLPTVYDINGSSSPGVTFAGFGGSPPANDLTTQNFMIPAALDQSSPQQQEQEQEKHDSGTPTPPPLPPSPPPSPSPPPPPPPEQKLGQWSNRFEYCRFCENNQMPWYVTAGHVLRSSDGKVTCPILRRVVCKICQATGDNAHTPRYCPLNPENIAKKKAPCKKDDSKKSKKRKRVK